MVSGDEVASRISNDRYLELLHGLDDIFTEAMFVGEMFVGIVRIVETAVDASTHVLGEPAIDVVRNFVKSMTRIDGYGRFLALDELGMCSHIHSTDGVRTRGTRHLYLCHQSRHCWPGACHTETHAWIHARNKSPQYKRYVDDRWKSDLIGGSEVSCSWAGLSSMNGRIGGMNCAESGGSSAEQSSTVP